MRGHDLVNFNSKVDNYVPEFVKNADTAKKEEFLKRYI